MKKRIICLILTLVMILGMLPANAFAATVYDKTGAPEAGGEYVMTVQEETTVHGGTLFTFTQNGSVAGSWSLEGDMGYSGAKTYLNATSSKLGTGSSVNSQSSWSLTMAEDGGVTLQNNTSSKYFLLFSNGAFTVSKTNADPIALYDADGKKLTSLPASPFKAYVCNPDGSKVLSSSTATEDPEKKVSADYFVTDAFELREDFASGTRLNRIGDAAIWKYENGKLTCGSVSFAYADGKLQNAAIQGGKLVSGSGTVAVKLWKKGELTAEQKDTYLFVTSDPHYKYRADFSSSLPADTQESTERLNSLINKASEDFGGIYFDTLISCGDNGDGNKSIVSNAFWDHVGKVIETAASNEHVLNTFFVLGNHEWHNGNYTRDTTNAVAKQFRQNGEVEEHEDYVLYAFGSEEDSNVFVAEDIAKLDSYLATAPTDKPIFVISHFPAHNYEQDMTLGEEVISTLTKYGDTHQLVFLWGHNHDEEDPHYGIVYTEELDGQPINFTYASGGCLNDVEYSSHSGKIAAKAFVAKIDEAKDLSITYYDINGNALSTTKAVKPEGHDFVKVDAAPATCTEGGAAVDCWYCPNCFRYFSDAEGKNEIPADSVELPAQGHSYKDGKCTRCGEADPHYKPGISYIKTDVAEAGKSYVIVSGGMALQNQKVEGISTSNVKVGYSLAGAPVTAANGVLTSSVSDDMLWTVTEGTSQYAGAYEGKGFVLQPYGEEELYLRRTSGSTKTAGLDVVGPGESDQYYYLTTEKDDAGNQAMFFYSEKSGDYIFFMNYVDKIGAFGAPGSVTCTGDWQSQIAQYPIEMYEVVSNPVPAGRNIDFTNSADSAKFEVINQTVSEITDNGFYMISTNEAFEHAKNQLSGDAAKNPRDVVEVPVDGDWTATLSLKVNCASNGGYEFLGFYGMTDYENGVGIRAGNGSTVNFKAIGGDIESSTTGLKVSHGLTTGENHWYKLEKVGTTYTGYTSEDGETFETIFTYADTGVDATKIVIDAYSGKDVGYEYWLQSLTFEGEDEPVAPEVSGTKVYDKTDAPEAKGEYVMTVREETALHGGTLFTFEQNGSTEGSWSMKGTAGYLNATQSKIGTGSSVNSQSSWTFTMAEDGGVTLQNNTSSKYYLLFKNDAFTVNKTNADPIALYTADGKKLTSIPASPFEAYICSPDGTKFLSEEAKTEDAEKKLISDYFVSNQMGLNATYLIGSRVSEIGDAAIWSFDGSKLTSGDSAFAYSDGKLQNAAIVDGKLVSGSGTVLAQLWKQSTPAAGQKNTYLFVTSDPHYRHRADFESRVPEGAQESIERLDSLINQASADFGDVYFDNVIICGDLGEGSIAKDAYWERDERVMETIANNPKVLREGFIICGNHEQSDGKYASVKTTNSIAKKIRDLGDVVETDEYAIFSFGAGQTSNNFNEEDIAVLDNYLATAPTDKPVFVVSHFPALNIDAVTIKRSEDVIKTLNKYGDTHQIIFLWGHNHDELDPHYGQVFTGEVDGKPINFAYASAGCLNDTEYRAVSAEVIPKGFAAKIAEDGSVSITYYDVNMKTLSTYEVSKPEGHDFVKVDAVPATCTEPGVAVDCWYCNNCFRYFSDAEGVNEISADEVNIPALRHDYKNGKCTRCGEADPHFKPGVSYIKTDVVEPGKQYVIVSNGMALQNRKVEGISTSSVKTGYSLAGAPVTTENDEIVSGVSDDMLWTVSEGTSQYAGAYADKGFVLQPYGEEDLFLRRTSGSTKTAGLDVVGPGESDQYYYLATEKDTAGNQAMFFYSEKSGDYIFFMNYVDKIGAFGAPGSVTYTGNWQSQIAQYPIEIYEYVSNPVPASRDIDFTNPEDASKFEIVNQTVSEITDNGFYMISTNEAFEHAKNQLSGDAAKNPRDVVEVPVDGDWTAVLNLKVNCASNGGYEFLGFYGMTDYENGVGVRAGNSSTVNFKAIGGNIESSTTGLKVSHGLTTGENHWYKLEKVGTTYTGYTSEDGETYETIFTYADTGVEATKIVIDAYSGKDVGYEYWLQSLTFEGGEVTPCQHEYESVVTKPTCLDGGYTTYVCALCGDSYVADETAALGHDYVEGYCSRCGAEDPNYVPGDTEVPILHPELPIYENPEYTFAERAADLVARMTPAQKGSQSVSTASAISASQLGGGTLNVPATKNIDSYEWWSEALHGYSRGNTSGAVSYPQNLTVASTWNPELYYREAVQIGDEIREKTSKNSQTGNAKNLNFYSPTVNMHRDPRWGRNEESFSEDVLLTGIMASEFVKGVEGKDRDGNLLDPDGYKKAMTTVKHYTANNSERNRLSGGAVSDIRAIREYYTAPYREVIQRAGVTSVMTAYSTLNGEPTSYSSYLMDTLLRQIFGLDGHITSDCDSTATQNRHGYVNPYTGETMTDLEALAGAMAHGEDLECNGGYSGFGTYASKMTKMLDAAPMTDKGTFTENALDVSLHHLMTDRIQTGEFDDDLAYTKAAAERTASQNGSSQTAERLAIVEAIDNEGVVMLKNNGILPLKPANGAYNVAIVGAWQTNNYLGLYSNSPGNQLNIQQGIVNALKAVKEDITFTLINSDSLTEENEAAIASADVAIVVTGTNSNYSKEDGDRTSIKLPNNLDTLISTVGKLNKNTIAIMETCGMMQVKTFENDVAAILWSSFEGMRKVGFGNVISGAVNPSGKLTDTWYQDVNDVGESDIPSILDYNMYATDGSNGRTYMYYVGEKKPSYVFGYGLSYTTYAYSNLKLDKTAYDANDTVKVSFDVKNTGSVAGKEITQLYVAQPDAPAQLLRPIKRLEGFDKIELQPGESKTVTMEVKVPDLAFYNEQNQRYEVDTGKYQIQVGTNSEAAASLTKDFTVSGKMDVYPELLTVKANQVGDESLGIEERIIFDKGAIINPQLTVAMNDESLWGYIIAHQESPIEQFKSTALPEGMTFTYTTNRSSVASVKNGVIKAENPGVATITVTGRLNGHVVTADFVVYVESNPLLGGITLNGEPVEGFAREKFAYELDAADYAGSGSGTSDKTVVMVGASDFQDPATSYARSDYAKNGDYTAQNETIKGILKNIKAAYSDIYSFVAGGDYGFDSNLNTTRTQTGVKDIRDLITAELGSDTKITFIQGNHDSAISDFNPTGAYDTEYYGMFTINEDDYVSKAANNASSAESGAKAVAAKLSTYLADKAKAGYDRPVFICTHVPLHFSTRTAYEGDAMYGKILYDAIQPYGDDLNIIFVFGHDHAWGDDDYLGGASVFLTDGDTINLAKPGSKTEFTTEKLNFTYLNYGYTGYYWSRWDSNTSGVRYSNADSTLTMTSFAITGNSVEITRWDANGKHDLKAVGKASQGNRGVSETCDITTNTYGPTVTVGEASAPAALPVVGYTVADGSDLKITVEQFTGIPGVASVTVTDPDSGKTNVYRLGLGSAPVSTDFSEGWAAAQAKGWTVSGAAGTFGENGLTASAETGFYSEPAYGDWAAQGKLTLAEAFTADNQQAGLIVKDTDDTYVKLVFERVVSSSWWSSSTNYYVTAYAVNGGEQNQIARSGNLGAITDVSLRVVKQDGAYSFGYSTDGVNWTDMSGVAKIAMADPKIGPFVSGTTATFDGINVCKVSELYPRLASVKLNGAALTDFDPEQFIYNFAVAEGDKAPVLAATAADPEIKVEITQLDATTGKASIRAYNDIAEATYDFYFGYAPKSDYFADGDISSDWTIERENAATYSVQTGKGLVLPTQSGDIHGTGGAWENCFTAPAQGNWQAVAKVVYPNVPTANYQQAMFLVWQDENNYLRLNCQTSALGMEPGVETAGSFNGNLGSGQALPAEDGTVTLYFLIDKADNNYSVGYSQDGVNFTMMNTAKNVNFANPRIGLFATQNSSSAQMDMYFEYVAVTWLNGVEQMTKDQMMAWASQNVADYVAAAIPAEASENITLPAVPHGYTVSIESSDPAVIAADGTVKVPAQAKNVKLTVKVSDAVSEATAVANVKVGSGEAACDHSYVAVVTAPTCTKAGYTTYTCSKCGDSYTADAVPALGHEYKDGKCIRCGAADPAVNPEIADEAVKAAVEAAKKAQAAAEAAQVAAEAAAQSAAADKTAAEAAKAAAEAAKAEAEKANAAAEAAKAAAEAADVDAAKQAAAAAGSAAEAAAEAALSAKAQAGAQAAQAAAEAAQKAAEDAQKKADEAAAMGKADAAEAVAAQKAADDAKAAAQDAKAAAVLAADAAKQSNVEAAEAAAKAAADSATVADALKQVAAAKAEVAAALAKAAEDKAAAEAALAAAEAAKAAAVAAQAEAMIAELSAAKYAAMSKLSLAASVKGDVNPEIVRTGIEAIQAAKDLDAVAIALEAALAALDAAAVTCPSEAFIDAPAKDNWAHEGIDFCIAKGYMNGTSANVFTPAGTVTRAQLVTILYRVAGEPEFKAAAKFEDVASGKWYSDAIAWAAENGVVKGVSETKFAPEDAITREQIAAILFRYSKAAAVDADLSAYPDAGSVSNYAKGAVAWAVKEGLINGIKTADATVLAPKDNATRAQIASIIMRFLDGSYDCK